MRSKDLIRNIVDAWSLCHRQPVAGSPKLVKDVAHQFGADTQFIPGAEDQMANEAIESMLLQENPDELEVSRPRPLSL